MDTCFGNGELSQRWIWCQSQSRRLLKEKKKASYSSQIPEMLRILGKQGQWNRAWSGRKSPMIGCPGRIKISYYIGNAYYALERPRGGGCGPREVCWVQAEKVARISSSSVRLLRLPKGCQTHPDQDTSKRRGHYFVPHLWSLLLFCHRH